MLLDISEHPHFQICMAFATLLTFAAIVFSPTLVALQQGTTDLPLQQNGVAVGPVWAMLAQSAAPQAVPKASESTAQSSPVILKDPPAIPVEQIIQQFAQREAEFKEERDNFTYVQRFVVQTIDDDGMPDGEYRLTTDITYTHEGRRNEVVTYAPPPTLERISLSEQDLSDLRNIQPFVLTTTELPKYDISYVGRQRVDEIGTYVFDVGPKKIEKNQRYFQGRIWVDDASRGVSFTLHPKSDKQ